MKRLTLATAAASLAFAALPAVAGENAVSESRANIERILGNDHREPHKAAARANRQNVVASTTVRDLRQRDRYERAHERLFGSRSAPSGQ